MKQRACQIIAKFRSVLYNDTLTLRNKIVETLARFFLSVYFTQINRNIVKIIKNARIFR